MIFAAIRDGKLELSLTRVANLKDADRQRFEPTDIEGVGAYLLKYHPLIEHVMCSSSIDFPEDQRGWPQDVDPHDVLTWAAAIALRTVRVLEAL